MILVASLNITAPNASANIQDPKGMIRSFKDETTKSGNVAEVRNVSRSCAKINNISLTAECHPRSLGPVAGMTPILLLRHWIVATHFLSDPCRCRLKRFAARLFATFRRHRSASTIVVMLKIASLLLLRCARMSESDIPTSVLDPIALLLLGMWKVSLQGFPLALSLLGESFAKRCSNDTEIASANVATITSPRAVWPAASPVLGRSDPEVRVVISHHQFKGKQFRLARKKARKPAPWATKGGISHLIGSSHSKRK